MKFFNYRFFVFLLFCIVASTVAMNLEGAIAAQRHADGVACRGRGRQNGRNNGGNGTTNSTTGGTT